MFHVTIGNTAAVWQIVDTSSKFCITGLIIAAAASAAADIAIAVVSFITLWRVSTAYTKTKSILKRVSVLAVTCGFVSAAATVVDLILLFENFTAFLVTFTLLGRVYTLTLLANFLLLKHLGSNETTIDTVGPTFRRNTTTVDGATVTGPAVFETRMSQDVSRTCDRSFTIPIDLSAQHSTAEGDYSTQGSHTPDFDHIKSYSSPLTSRDGIRIETEHDIES
ncbi:hypothetical protein VKT23_005073 [Stygiomarasmius scandens]|uniref:DUF6534 domain-containing protein n=1 Tax=Marasmiellus scandens TaxID=2682957 RepID=A0ABR1JS23_9AGAR